MSVRVELVVRLVADAERCDCGATTNGTELFDARDVIDVGRLSVQCYSCSRVLHVWEAPDLLRLQASLLAGR